jgi:hypothetical protein
MRAWLHACRRAALRQYRIWRCKRDYSRLSARNQRLARSIGIDPESKIKRGDFDHEY